MNVRPLRIRLSGLLLLVCAVGVPAWSQGDAAAKEPSGRVVLVLPFDNHSGQPNLGWIGDSFPDTLNARLSSAGYLPVSRDDRQYALDHLGLPVDFRPSRASTIRIAQNLDADYVIVGSYNIEKNRIQVQAQVLEVNKLKMSAPLLDSADLPRLFDVENAIAWKIARQIEPQFSVAEETFVAASAGVKLSAFENYVRGTAAPNPTERVKRLEEAVKDSPTYAPAVLALGKELYNDREYDRASMVLSRISKSDRLALEANFFLGLSRFNDAKYAEAEGAFAFVSSRLPLSEVVNDQAVAQSRQGRDGTPLFQRVVTSDPNDADYRYNLAVSMWRHGDFAGAQTQVDAALKVRPNDPDAKQLKGLIAGGRGLNSLPETGFQPTERLRRTYSEAAFRQAAFQLDQVRQIRLATLPKAQQAVEYAQLGRDYLNQGLLPEAEQEFNAAITADPASPAGHAGMAQVREASGNTEQARTESQLSLRIQPNVEAYLVLSRLDLAKGDLPASAMNVQAALRLEPKNGAALGMRQALVNRGQAVN